MVKIFVDGEYGTTGLQICSRLAKRNDIELLSLSKTEYRNTDLRIDFLRAADIAILCLPDNAAREVIQYLEGYATRIIDSSTANRTAQGWIYGFAELTKGQRKQIISAQRVSNPGCYPTGAISLIRPLREAGLLADDYPITINAVSGYTGGGHKLTTRMEDASHPDAIHASYFLYNLTMRHKHIPEIMVYSQLSKVPVFTPGVGRFPQGMIICVPLHLRLMERKADISAIHDIFRTHYDDQNVIDIASEEDVLSTEWIHAEELSQTDQMKLYITGSDKDQIINLVAVLDNLGKGAAGAAIQNLDLMLGSLKI
ncbi:MAG: N-acetyl-gamma-glutamyl-phosphate reductase [Candidatus Tokpelaia sp. JSC085]|nr:MAG: N-acetyl-gamma-glutamyl-phosphate reductase [Candidatus Tokpelaia sp. JSC085]